MAETPPENMQQDVPPEKAERNNADAVNTEAASPVAQGADLDAAQHADTTEPPTAVTPSAPVAAGIGLDGRRGTAPILVAKADSPDATDAATPAEAALANATEEAARPAGQTTAQNGASDGVTAGVPVAGGADSSEAASAAPHAASAAPPPPVKASRATQSFKLMALLGPLFLLLFLAAQTAAGIFFPSLYLPQEIAAVSQYENCLQAGQFWVSGSQMPGYYWFVAMVHALGVVPEGMLLPVVAALSAAVALCGAYALALGAGLGTGIAFGAGLVLLSSVGFVSLSHFFAPELLFAGVLSLSLACLGGGLRSEVPALGRYVLGGVLGGVAFCIGGILALWLLLVSALCFIVWRGTLRRVNRLDAVLGFAVFWLCIACWLIGAILLSGDSAGSLEGLFTHNVAPYMWPLWPPKDPWWQALALFALAFCPWIVVPVFVNWFGVLGGAWRNLAASRKERAGTAWLWIALVCGLTLCSLASVKPFMMTIALLPLGAVLLAKALLRLSPRGSQVLFLVIALCMVLKGAMLTLLSFPVTAEPILAALAAYLPQDWLGVVPHMQGLPIVGAVFLLSGVALLKLTDRRQPAGALAVTALLVTILTQPLALMLVPSLHGHMGAKHAWGEGVYVIQGDRIVPRDAKKATPVEIESVPAPQSDAAQPVAPAAPAEVPAAPAPQSDAPQGTPEGTVAPTPAN